MVLGSGIRDPGSGIRKKPVPDPGSRGQKAPNPGSRIRIRITDDVTQCITLIQASLIAVSSWCNTCINCPSLTPSLQINQILKSKFRSSLERMRSSLVIRASDCQCPSCNGPGFDPSIRRHSGIWGAADEAMLNKVRKKYKKSPPPKKNSLNFCAATMETTHTCSLLLQEIDQAQAIDERESTPKIRLCECINWWTLAGGGGMLGWECYCSCEFCDCGASSFQVHNNPIMNPYKKPFKVKITSKKKKILFEQNLLVERI